MIEAIRKKMANEKWQEPLVEKLVTYTLELDGKVFVVKDVPARVNKETGEQLFSLETVEKLQSMILDGSEPQHFMKVPVYQYMNSVA